MPYWVASDLAQYLPQPVLGTPLIGATSNPVNLTKFARIISLVESEVEGAAAQAGYTVPVPTTATVAFEYVANVVSAGARWQALELVMPGNPTADEYKAAYHEALGAIRSGRQPLLSASRDLGEEARALPRYGGIASPAISASWAP